MTGPAQAALLLRVRTIAARRATQAAAARAIEARGAAEMVRRVTAMRDAAVPGAGRVPAIELAVRAGLAGRLGDAGRVLEERRLAAEALAGLARSAQERATLARDRAAEADMAARAAAEDARTAQALARLPHRSRRTTC